MANDELVESEGGAGGGAPQRAVWRDRGVGGGHRRGLCALLVEAGPHLSTHAGCEEAPFTPPGLPRAEAGPHDGQHELVEDLLGGANVGLVVDLLLLKQSESSVARPSRTSHSEAPLLRQDLLDDVLERDHPDAARLAAGELALARDRLRRA